MSCAHDHYNGPVLVVIIYTDQNCKDKNFLIMALKDRFGKLSKQFEVEIRQSNFNTLVKLRKSLFNFSSIEDVYGWWDKYGNPIKKK